ncbi:ribonuclease E, partial [Pseudomonas syringae pv. actinidiae ICMP 19070]
MIEGSEENGSEETTNDEDNSTTDLSAGLGFTAAAVGGVISATAEADAHQQAERANSTTESVPAAEPVQ